LGAIGFALPGLALAENIGSACDCLTTISELNDAEIFAQQERGAMNSGLKTG